MVTHNVMQISGGGKVLELKPSSLVACSVVCRRLRAGCSRLFVVFVIHFDSFRLLVQHVVYLKAGGVPDWIVYYMWSHWAEFRIRKSFIAKCVCTHKEFVLVLGASSIETIQYKQTTVQTETTYN